MNRKSFLKSILVAPLAGLATLTTSANTKILPYNTNLEFVKALDRCQATAEDAGIPFVVLAGLIHPLLVRTKRGGDVCGNALKTIFVRIQRPEIISELQKFWPEILVNNKPTNCRQVLTFTAYRYARLSKTDQWKVAELLAGVRQSIYAKIIMTDLSVLV